MDALRRRVYAERGGGDRHKGRAAHGGPASRTEEGRTIERAQESRLAYALNSHGRITISRHMCGRVIQSRGPLRYARSAGEGPESKPIQSPLNRSRYV
jgi:hypothetical protein